MAHRPFARILLTPLLFAPLLFATAALLPAQEREAPAKTPRNPEAVLRGLGQGIEALQALGRHQEAEHLAAIARELKQNLAARKPDGADKEREIAKHQLEVMRVAKAALREGERHDALELLERAMHARELALAGRQDAEAMQVRRDAPQRQQIAKVLGLAAELYAGFGQPDRAELVARLAREFGGKETAAKEGDRDAHHRQLELLGAAAELFRDAGHERAVGQLEQAMHAHKLALLGRSDEEARQVMARAPSPGQQAELFAAAAKLAAKAEKRDLAEILAAASHEHAAHAKHPQQRSQEAGIAELAAEIKRMQKQLAELQERLGRLAR